MAENEKYTKWEPKTMDCIRQNSSIFKSVAARMGISAEALAGAMAKENNPYQRNTAMEVFKDTRAVKEIFGGTVDHAQWSDQYDAVKKANWIDNADTFKKISAPILVDFGPFNLQGATAIKALNEYVQANPHSDPYNLKQYQGDYAKFLATIAGPAVAPREYPVSAEENVRVNAFVWGMLIKNAQDWFENKKRGDEGFVKYWDGLPQWTKDALYGQWCIMGPDKMDEKYLKNINDKDHPGTYKPKLGEDDSGGLNIAGNSKSIGAALGNGRYGVNTDDPGWQGKLYSGAAPASPPAGRITYNTDGTVTVNKGGTLWEICEEQRKKGNPITPDDLRSFNKNIRDVPDTGIPAGTKLIIPKRQGDKDETAALPHDKESGDAAKFGGNYLSDRDSSNAIQNKGGIQEVTFDEPVADTPDAHFTHAFDALGVASKDVHLIPDGDNENPMPGSYSIMDKSTSKEIGSCLMTTTGCEMTAGDRKVVMDKISGSDVSLQTYAKNDDGEYELLGTTRIGDNGGVTVRRPFAGLA